MKAIRFTIHDARFTMKYAHLILCIVNCAFCIPSFAQVQCIQCYNQNARVLTDTNNLILNGGFENTNCPPYRNRVPDTTFCPNSTYYHCTIANWTCIGGGSGTYADICDSVFSVIVEGSKAVYFGNLYSYVCPTGDTSCMNNMGCEATGIPTGYPINEDTINYGIAGVSLMQTINGLTTGSIYTLEFWAGGEDFFAYDGLFSIDVGFGKIFLRDHPTQRHTGIGTRYVIAFIATSSSHTIKFTNWGHMQVDTLGEFTTELILDDVRLFAATEGNPCITSTNDLSQNAIATVFPNPATNLLTITTTSKQSSEITLYDITSRPLMQKKFNGSATLNIENLAKGVYLYEVKDENGLLKQGKVVKE